MYVSGLYNYQLKSTCSNLVLQNVKWKIIKIYKCNIFIDNKGDDDVCIEQYSNSEPCKLCLSYAYTYLRYNCLESSRAPTPQLVNFWYLKRL